MTKPAVSVFAFGIWCLLAGAPLLFVPEFMGWILGLTFAEPIYVRIIGFILIEIGILYLWIAKNANDSAFRLTIFVRVIPVAALTFFVVSGLAPWQLILFAIVDAGSAAHTWWTLGSKPSA